VLDAVERVDDRFERLLFLTEFLRALRVVPQLGILELVVQRLEARLLACVVKDTSAARRFAKRGRRAMRRFD